MPRSLVRASVDAPWLKEDPPWPRQLGRILPGSKRILPGTDSVGGPSLAQTAREDPPRPRQLGRILPGANSVGGSSLPMLGPTRPSVEASTMY